MTKSLRFLHYTLMSSLGIFGLSSLSVAQATPSKPETSLAAPTKLANAKPANKKVASHKSSKKTPLPSATDVPGGEAGPAEGETWQCEMGNAMHLKGDLATAPILTMNWRGKNYQLPRQETTTGAERYFDAHSGMDLVIIPNKAMLFNRGQGTRLADDCKTTAMLAGAAAQTRAEILRNSLATAATPVPTESATSLLSSPAR